MSTQRSESKIKTIYFDNASSSVRSSLLIEKLKNIWGKQRTREEEVELLKKAEEKIKNLLSIKEYSSCSISFVPNATYGLNEIAYSLTPNRSLINPEKITKDIYLSDSEHAANHLVWLKLSSKDIHYFSLKDFHHWIPPSSSSIVSLVCSSNLEGISVDLEDIENKLRGTECISIVDASQLLQYQLPILSDSCIDYLVFTAHKCFGPNGIGVVYSKNTESSIGLNSGNYLEKGDSYRLNLDSLEAWIESLDEIKEIYGRSLEIREKLNEYFIKNFPYGNEYIELINKDTKGFIFLLLVKSEYISSHDFCFYLNRKKVIVRAGIACSWLSGEKYDSNKIIRVSLGPFNTTTEIDYFFDLIKRFSLEMCL